MKQLLAKIWRKANLPKAPQLFLMRFVNDEFLVGVTGVILNKDNEVLLLKHTYRQTPWSLPGGYLKRGEHPREGIAREILEETGFEVEIKRLVRTWHDKSSARLDIGGYGIFVKGRFKSSAEVSDYQFFPFEKLPHIGTKQKKLIELVLREEKKHPTQTKNWWNFLTIFRKR